MRTQAIFEKKNVLVVGGAGFIGSHLCDELIKDSKVICIDDFSTGDEKNIDHLLSNPSFEFVRHDISEPLDLESMPGLQKFKIQFQGIQEIYNLACPTLPKQFAEHRIKTILANSLGVKNILDLVLKYKSKFLHFSSSVVYGPRREDELKIKEDDIGAVDFLSPRSSYDEGKRFAETMIINYRDYYGIDSKILRLFRIYGPRMKLGQGNMIPDFINNALENKDLEIFGDESFYSSACYSSDCVDAAISMMAKDVSRPINIGSDMDMKLVDIAQKIIDMTGSKSKIVFSPKHLFITPLAIPDISQAREELGWLPVVNIDKGLEKTIEDLQANKGLKRVNI